ncbi:MAG: undecaprenyl-diphosphate phosphatase [Deltaproteobacteria bacterium]|nr:undecaprenyl-diphosphate phosphatase [Deltaproteobacteria bacterium]
MDILKTIVLGIVEGVTEFLPVSSTGHLILAGNVLGFTGEKEKVFEIFIQLGAILSVVWLYRARLAFIIRGIGTAKANSFLIKIFLAFLPSAIVGLLVHSYIKHYLFNPITVAIALVGGGIAIISIEKTVKKPQVLDIDAISYRLALGVGLFQVLSLFPGVSRAGATIMGGIILRLERKVAAEFSFFLAIPTMFAASSFDLFKGAKYLETADLPIFALGFATAFVSAILVIKVFLGYIARNNFLPFGYYRIVFGIVALLYYLYL